MVFICQQDDVCENYIGSVNVGWYCGLSESGHCVFGKLCPVGFPVVCKSSSVVMLYVMMSYVMMSYGDCGNDG